jgi:hypothetical protein
MGATQSTRSTPCTAVRSLEATLPPVDVLVTGYDAEEEREVTRFEGWHIFYLKSERSRFIRKYCPAGFLNTLSSSAKQTATDPSTQGKSSSS